jgi:hypothetical protein
MGVVIMYKFKLNHKLINKVYFNFDLRSYYYYNPLNKNHFKKIVYLTYLKELQYKKTILKTIDLKIISFFNIKKDLNLKKKTYINQIRFIYNSFNTNDLININKDNNISLNNNSLKDKFNFVSFKNDLINLKVFKNDFINNIEYYSLYKLFIHINNNNDLFNKLININTEIKKYEYKIKTFKEQYKQITNRTNKLNSWDIKQFKKGFITENIKTLFYFYLIKMKKSKRFKENINLNKLNNYIKIGLINNNDFKILLNNNLNIQNLKYINNYKYTINKKYHKDILNKYI